MGFKFQPSVRLIDSHCHLDGSEFDNDRNKLIKACKQNGIVQFIVPGTRCAAWPNLIKLSKCYPECHVALGLHPIFLDEHRLSHLDVLVENIQRQQPIAVGEIGLDYFIKTLDKERQQIFFESQLVLACDFDLPVILHVRKAHDESIRVLKKNRVKGGIVHAFNGSFQQARQYLDLGFKLGFGGALTFDRARHLRKLARQLPLEAIVLETDSPDMNPVNAASSRNTPLTIVSVLQVLTELREETSEHIAEQTTLNVEQVLELNFS